MKSLALAALLTLPALLALQAPARACACCPDDDAYVVEAGKPGAFERDELRKLRFGGTARLVGGEREPEDFAHLAAPAASYPLAATATAAGWRLALRAQGKDAVLTLAMPTSLERYQADIHDGKRFGAGGPLLYKEWRLAGALTDGGFFKPGPARATRYRLVLQGRGGACPEAAELTHWRLELIGPKGTTALAGTLAR